MRTFFSKGLKKLWPNLFNLIPIVLFLIFLLVFTPVLRAADSITAHQHGKTFYPTYPTPNYGTGTQADLIKKGEYLVKMGDCISCHTDTDEGKQAQPFAGGLGIDTPFGTIYTPNITPDKETGIGNWKDEDFIRALHDGVSPEGYQYYPAFPYTSFHYVTDDDIRAIAAYLRSIPAVKQKDKKNAMPWPFSWRFMMVGWKTMFFYGRHAYFKPDPTKSAQWNRGAYLVLGLGHCGECHTPRGILGEMKQDKFLGGAFVDGYYAPNISSYGLKQKKATEKDIVDVFSDEEMLGGTGKVQGPMAEVDHNSLKYINQSDLEAIAVFLESTKPVVPKKTKDSGKVSQKAAIKIYNSKCAACHASGAAGAPIVGDVKDWKPRIALGLPTLYKNAINGINSMPPRGTCMSCSDNAIDAVVDYMVAQSKPGAKKAAGPMVSKAPTTNPKPRPSIAQGKVIYDKVCSACHTRGVLGAPVTGDKQAWAPIIKQNVDVLFERSIKGYKSMPAMGGCETCSNGDIEAAVKYMVQESSTKGDYSLW